MAVEDVCSKDCLGSFRTGKDREGRKSGGLHDCTENEIAVSSLRSFPGQAHRSHSSNWRRGVVGRKDRGMTRHVDLIKYLSVLAEEMQAFVNSSDPTAKFFFNEAAFYYCYLLCIFQ